MSPARTPSPLTFLPTSALLILVGLGGMAILLNFTLPTLWPRWLFYFLIVCAGTGLAMPFSAYLNHRFPSDPPARSHVILRQALWVGIFAATLAWLQNGRVFNGALAIIIGLGFGGIEYVLRLRERSQWNP